MLMCIQILVKFCLFVLKILSRNEILTSIKGRNSVANLQKMTIYNTNIDLVNDNVYTNLVKFCPFVLKILSGNENYDGITELQNDIKTEGQTGQIQYSPHFFKAGL